MTLTEEYDQLTNIGRTPREAADEIIRARALKISAQELIDRIARSRSAPIDASDVDSVSMLPLSFDPDELREDFEDYYLQAIELASVLKSPENRQKLLSRLGLLALRAGSRLAREHVDDLARLIANFRLRDPERLRRRIARATARGDIERASELQIILTELQSRQQS